MRCMKETNGLIDTGADVDYEPTFALCKGCIADLAACAGYRIYTVADHESELQSAQAMADAWRFRALEAEELLTKVSAAAVRIKNLTPKTDA